jgi:hypothetical protein
MSNYTTGTGQRLSVHDVDDCDPPCPIHAPSDHSMLAFPTHWRADRAMMERVCPHGVGHPDPDDKTDDRAHGCCGCCRV